MTDDPAMSWGWEDLGSMPTGIASCIIIIIIIIILSLVTSAVPTLWACHVDQGATPTKVWAFDFAISWEIPSKKPKETIHSTGRSFSLGIWLKTVAFCSFSTWFWSVLKPCNFQFYLSSSQNRRVEPCKLNSDWMWSSWLDAWPSAKNHHSKHVEAENAACRLVCLSSV